MIKAGERKNVTYWGNYTVKKVVQLTEPVVCHHATRGKAIFEPTIVQIEWEKAPSGDKHEFSFPYWITWSDNGKQRYGQQAPMIGETSLLELLKTAIADEFFSNGFLQKLRETITDKLDFEQRN